MKRIIKELEEQIEKAYADLRSRCKTYKELEEEIEEYEKEAKWDREKVNIFISEILREKYNQEIESLKMLPLNGSKD